jgi:hypothetical protein
MILENLEKVFILAMLGFGLIKYLESRKLKKSLKLERNKNNELEKSVSKLLHRINFYRERVSVQEKMLVELNEDLMTHKIKSNDLRKENYNLKSQLELKLFCEVVANRNKFEITDHED